MKFRQMMRAALVLLGITAVLSPNAIAQQRLGLHVTQEELNIWKQRAANGPYKTKGDVSKGSPGTWDRVKSNADAFLANPSAERYTNQTKTTSCVGEKPFLPSTFSGGGEPEPGFTQHKHLQHAALYYLITGNAAYREAVKNELLFHAGLPGLDWNNTSVWCYSKGLWYGTHPYFIYAHWMTRLLYAYDLIRNDIDANSRAKLDAWFYSAMKNWPTGNEYGYVPGTGGGAGRQYWVDPFNGDFTLTKRAFDDHANITDGWTHYKFPYAVGRIPSRVTGSFHNRVMALFTYTGLAGALFKAAGYGVPAEVNRALDSTKNFIKLAITFGTFPDGTFFEFHRNHDGNPQSGWGYTGGTLLDMTMVADALARIGDTSLYDFVTSDGMDRSGVPDATKGGPKSLKTIWLNYVQHVNQTTPGGVRYGTDVKANVGNQAYITGPVAKSCHRPNDTGAAMANIYYHDSKIKDIYMRTAPNSPPYGSPVCGGDFYWSRDFPADILGLFGQMEGKVWPYPVKGTHTTPPRAPKNLSLIIK